METTKRGYTRSYKARNIVGAGRQRATPQGQPAHDLKGVIMKKYNFTAEDFNAMLDLNEFGVKHSVRYNFLREKFGYMGDEQFDEVYSAFYEGSTGIIHNAAKKVTDREAKVVNFILTLIAGREFPISFSDAYFSDEKPADCCGMDLRDRAQKIVDTLEKKGAIEGLRVIRIMTQGTCHIKLYEIR